MFSPAFAYRDLPLRYIRDPRLGHRLGRSFPADQHSDETWGTPWLGTNAAGLYGHVGDLPSDSTSPESIRVVLLGGSAAMGLGATAPQFTIRAALESSLRNNGASIYVINGAVGDYASSQSLLYFVTELIELKPHIVVVLDGFNDFSHSTWGSKYSGGAWLPNFTRSYDDGVIGVLSWDKSFEKRERLELKWRKSKIAQALKRRQRKRRRSATVQTHGQHGMVWDDPTDWSVKPEAIDWYLTNTRSLTGVVRASGAKLLHVIQPSLLWSSAKRLTDAEDQSLTLFNQRMPRLHELAQTYHDELRPRYLSEAESILNSPDMVTTGFVDFADGTDILDAAVGQTYSDPVHYNDEGQLTVGEWIANRIRSNLWVQ